MSCGKDGVGILQPSWQVLNCHVGQVRMDPGAAHAPPQTRGMPDTGMFVGQGTSLFLEPARVEHRAGVGGSGARQIRI